MVQGAESRVFGFRTVEKSSIVIFVLSRIHMSVPHSSP